MRKERMELAEREKAEMAVLVAYMPEQLSEEIIRDPAKKRWSNPAPMMKKNLSAGEAIGKVMAVLMPQVKGKSDGALVNKIVRGIIELV